MIFDRFYTFSIKSDAFHIFHAGIQVQEQHLIIAFTILSYRINCLSFCLHPLPEKVEEEENDEFHKWDELTQNMNILIEMSRMLKEEDLSDPKVYKVFKELGQSLTGLDERGEEIIRMFSNQQSNGKKTSRTDKTSRRG